MCVNILDKLLERFLLRVFFNVDDKHLLITFYQGQVTTITGNNNDKRFADYQSQKAHFGCLPAVCYSIFHDSLFFCDSKNHIIIVIDLKTGISNLFSKLFLLHNTGNASVIGSGIQGFKDGTDTEAQFNCPFGISPSESDGSLLVCDYVNNKIRKIIFEGTFV